MARTDGEERHMSDFRRLKKKLVVTKTDHNCMFCGTKISDDTPALYIVGVRRGRLEAGYICSAENCSGLSDKTWKEMVADKKYSTEFKHDVSKSS
jgi:hypothetical protein